MNETTQTAYEIGREYSAKLQEMVTGYEYLSGKPITADCDFWDSREVNKIEVLSALWWQIGRYNDPFFYDDSFIEENNNETN